MSPKARMQNKIGNKGTGFRSVLSWSEEVMIKSGALSVGFSEKFARQFLEVVKEIEPLVKEYLEENKAEDSIATLVVPKWMDDLAVVESTYDTSIRLKLLPEVIDDVHRQLRDIDCETLLFLNHIERLTIKINNQEFVFKKSVLERNVVVISLTEDGREVRRKRWTIKKESKQYKGKNYELTIAYTEKLDDRKNILYSYFKTDVSFPFPAVIHGTFNLDANRNHLLKENDENIYLLKRLGGLLIETALEMTNKKEPGYEALSLLCSNGEFSPEISEMGFEEHLLSGIKNTKVFPTINRQYVTFGESPKFFNVPFADLLPRDSFSNLMLYTDKPEIVNVLERLSDGESLEYDYSDFYKRLNKTSANLNMKQRVKIIQYILDIYSWDIRAKGAKTPNLIIDNEGNPISKDDVIFIYPSKAEALETPPKFSKIKFLNPTMSKYLRDELSVSSPRDLASKLHDFGVREYAFDTVTGRILSRLRKRIKNQSKSIKSDIITTTKWFYSVYQTADGKNKANPQKDFYLINRQGDIVPAKDLYIGKEYGHYVCENLLSEIAPDRFVAGAGQLGIPNDNELEMIEFLSWLGANRYPQIEVKYVADEKNEYLEYVKSKLTFPISIEDCSFETIQDFNREYRSCRINVAQVEWLDSILEKVPTKYILDWLMDDERVSSIIDKGVELTSQSGIGFYFGYKSLPRTLKGDKVAAYVSWKLQNANWIDVKDKRVSPTKCCLARNSGIDFSPLVEYPDLTGYVADINERKNKTRKRELYEEYLMKTGVASDFGGINEKTVYSILHALPSVDPEGKKAKSFYRQIIQNSELDEWEVDDPTYNDYLKNGKVFAVIQNEKKYLPVHDVFYLDDKTVCKAVVNSFPLLDLDKRKGKDKVEKILGVRPFKKQDFTFNGEPDFHPYNREFKADFKNYLPYAYCYRYHKDPKGLELKKLMNLDLNICTDLQVFYNDKETILEDFEYVEHGKNRVFIKVPGKSASLTELHGTFEFRDAIAEIISSSIDVEGNRKDYRELYAKKESERKKTVLSDFDNQDLIREVKRLFQQEYNEQYQFWIDVMKAVAVSFDEDKFYTDTEIRDMLHLENDLFDQINRFIDFEDLHDLQNAPYLINLFDAVQIDFEDFNRKSVEKLSLIRFFDGKYQEVKDKYSSKYAAYLYDMLSRKDIKEKQRFQQLLVEYDQDTISFENSIKIDVKAALFARYIDLDKITEPDLDAIYFNQKQVLKLQLGIDDAMLNEFLANSSYDSLVFFGEISALQKFYLQYLAKERDMDAQYTGESLADALVTVKKNQYTIVDILDTTIPKTEGPASTGRNGSGKGTGFVKSKNTEKIGLKGERFVYALLKENYTEVDWVSENAKADGVNAHGKAGLGYDLTYLNEENKKIFVEVKTTTGDADYFYLSANELDFAEQHADHYEIIFAANINDEKKKFYRLKDLFQYGDDENRYSNKKFRLDAREYRIQAKKPLDVAQEPEKVLSEI
ncbi:DUF3883 domain-containing protein [Bacillus salipaludis]|uniref:DUF3883 domain-containing protein n=1 Tax=Bacillus salipaludis TaxID=2547811 RepID=UPI003D1FCE65